MKSRFHIPESYKKQAEEQMMREINEKANAYLDSVKREISRRLCYAAILCLDDAFRTRFGRKDETINRNYQRFALMLKNMINDYNRDCYEWNKSKDMEAMSKAMRAELLERGIEVEFE